MRITSLVATAVLVPALGTHVAAQTLPHELVSPNGQLFGGFGLAVDGVGDVTGDGIPDVAVGADGENGPTGAFAGRAYVFDGASGAVVYTLQSPNHQSGAYFGVAVAGVGDVDGGGLPDILVGARAATGPPDLTITGRAFLYRGEDGSLALALSSPNGDSGGNFGGAVAAAGDVDGDGRPDMLVAAEGENTSAGLDAGRVYLFSGAGRTVIHALEAPQPTWGALFGRDVAGLGDLDGDGRSEFAISGFNEHDGDGVRAGRVHVFSGATGEVMRTLTSPNPTHFGAFGASIAAAGDVDGDGRQDLIVGAPTETPAGQNSGRAYLFSGATGASLLTLVSPNAAPQGRFGIAVAGAGDINADGAPDLLVSAANEHTTVGFGAGRVYALDGATGALLATMESPNGQTGGMFGNSVASAGDADGDGRSEMLVGAVGETTPAGATAGRAYVLPLPVFTAGEPAGGRTAALRIAPNPVRGAARISLSLPAAGPVRLAVFDALGREVARPADGRLAAGAHAVTLPPLPAGVYAVRLEHADGTAVARLAVHR